jgi:hypothetical protein
MMFLFYYDKQTGDLIYIQSTIDNKKYLVRNTADKQKAADTLAQISKELVKIVDHLQSKYPDREDIQRLISKFNPDSIMETEPDSKHTSYSVNKGEKIHMCIRSKEGNQDIEEFNTLMFVSLHELSHVMTKSVGHTKEFWNNIFRFIRMTLPEVIMDREVFGLWNIRASGYSDLIYLDVRRINLYNPTSYKKLVTIRTHKHFAFMKMVDPERAQTKSTLEGVQVELLPNGSVALDFGHFEEI